MTLPEVFVYGIVGIFGACMAAIILVPVTFWSIGVVIGWVKFFINIGISDATEKCRSFYKCE